MIAPAFPANEIERNAALHALHILDTPHEERFDRIIRLAARVFDVPIVLVSLVDMNRQWFKSCIGLPEPETPRNISFCAHAILGDDTLVIPDATLDPRFADNPLVTGEPFIRFYAGHLLRSSDGHKLGTLCIIDVRPRDLTEQDHLTLRDLAAMVENEINKVELARALEAQRESEERFRQLAENIDQVFWISEADTLRRIYVSPAYERVWGYSCESLLRDPFSFLEALHPDDRERVRAAQEHQRTGIYNEEYRVVHPNGEVRWIWARAFPIVDEHGEVYRVAGIAEDITDRKRAEEAQNHYRAIVESSADVILGKTLDGIIVSWNPAAEHIYGYTAEEVQGHSISILVPPDQPDEIPAILARIRRGERIEQYETVRVRKDGALVNVSLTISPIKDATGQITGAATIARDITAQKQAEAALAEARDQALEASRLKSEFLATMSHEIRTPMNAIIGMTDILLETPLDDDQHEFASIVRESAHALLTIINDILDFSKIEAGKLVLDRVDFDLRGVVEGVAEILANRAHEKGLALLTYVDPRIPALQGDPGRLRQVLLNLAGNAIKFTSTGEVVIRATLENSSDTEFLVRVTVSDTGIGISEAARRRLFQPFTQADSSTTRKHGGTGLGLAISRRLVEMMKGEIGVESTEGEGSTFWFTARFQPATSPMEPVVPTIQPDVQGARVLVIDDSTTSRDILHHYITACGLQSNEVPSGNDALLELHRATAAQTPYDLAIVDLAMPDMDGFAVARAILRDRTIAAPALILLTAFDERGQGEQALAAGFSAYLTKPLRQALLFEAMTKAISARRELTADVARPRLRTRALAGSSTRPTPLRSERPLLLVEDNLANQKVALVQLQRLGYQVDVATNGEEAVASVTQPGADYAAVLMDVQMPVMDGYAATREIRKAEIETGKHVPIIAMTANAMQGDRETALAVGMDEYVSKPLDWDKVRQVLDHWVS